MKEFLELFAAVEGAAHCGDVAPCLGVSKANNGYSIPRVFMVRMRPRFVLPLKSGVVLIRKLAGQYQRAGELH
jgi:hypothetical protein